MIDMKNKMKVFLSCYISSFKTLPICLVNQYLFSKASNGS